jgi:hypothetical protein
MILVCFCKALKPVKSYSETFFDQKQLKYVIFELHFYYIYLNLVGRRIHGGKPSESHGGLNLVLEKHRTFTQSLNFDP